MPTVSVMMNCHNGAAYLREAIDSVYAQSFADWEIVLWDNASTDATAEIARSYDARLHYHFGRDFVSLGAARRLAAEVCRGEFVALLDCDDVWRPMKLEKQIAVFRREPAMAIVYSDALVISPEGRPLRRYFSKLRPYRGHVFDRLLLKDFIPCPTAMVRTDAIRSVGGFDPALGYAEEWDLFLKIAAKYPCDFLDEPLASYRISSTGFSRNVEGCAQEELQVMQKWMQSKPEIGSRMKRKLNERMAASHRGLARYRLISGNERQALEEVIASLRLWPLDARAYVLLALCMASRSILRDPLRRLFALYQG